MLRYTSDAPLVISSEEEAWVALKKISKKVDVFESHDSIVFDGWPVFKAYAPPERLDSALTPYMMEGFVDLQRAVFRTYAFVLHDDPNGRRLSNEEKERLELVVKVSTGSSDGSIDLTGILTETLTSAVDKMEPTHLIVTIIGIALVFSGASVFRTFLDNRTREKIETSKNEEVKEALQTVRFSEEKDVERMQILSDVMKQSTAVQQASLEANDALMSIVKHYTRSQDAEISGVPIEGELGQELTRNSRQESEEVRIDGIFRILKVDTTAPDGFMVTLESSDGQLFSAGVQDALISEEHKKVISDAEWAKSSIEAKINARKRRGVVVSAIIIEAVHHKNENSNNSD